jgi:hypothetical protein
MRKILCSLLAAMAMLSAIAQTGVPGQISTSTVQVKNYSTTGTIHRPCMLWLPASYNNPFDAGKNYPLLVFMHGLLEGSSFTGVTGLRTHGPFHFLYNNLWDGTADIPMPPSEGEEVEEITDPPPVPCVRPFIVFAMQSEGYTDIAELDYAIGQLALRYRIDGSKIFLTGISAGGESTTSYAFDLTRTYRPKHIVPMSIVGTNNSPNLATIVNGGMKAWAFTYDNASSLYHLSTNTLVDNFNNILPGSAKITSVIVPDNTPGHCCWNTFYDPAYRETEADGSQVNIYEWLQKNAGYDNESITGCPAEQCSRKHFAGFVSAIRTDKFAACDNIPCSTPVFTSSGLITTNEKVLTNGCHNPFISEEVFYLPEGKYGLSTSTQGGPPEKYLVVDANGGATVYENCISLAGYISAATPDESVACNPSTVCSTAVYTRASVVVNDTLIYLSANGSPFNGGWMKYGFSTTLNGAPQSRMQIPGDGKISNYTPCGGGRTIMADESKKPKELVTSIAIFPNPANNQFTIQLPAYSEPVRAMLYNMSGTIVYEARVNGTMHRAAVQHLAKGVYALKLMTASGKLIHTSKVILQ